VTVDVQITVSGSSSGGGGGSLDLLALLGLIGVAVGRRRASAF